MARRLRSFSFRLGAAASLAVLGAMALLQVAAPGVAEAASSSAIFGWGAIPAVESLPADVMPTAVAAGWQNGYAIGSDDNLYAWGPNINGSLPIGEVPVDATNPVLVTLPNGATPTVIAGAFDAGYAIGSDGNLYAWGWNGQGELGIGNTTGPDACPVNGFGQPGPTLPCAATPVQVNLPSGVKATVVATSGETESQPSSAYAIGSDGKLYAWGDNGSGQLGDGSTTASDTPVVVSLPTNVIPVAISGGSSAAYAIASDGNVYAWGDNIFGELGDGSTTSSSTPVKVSLPAGVAVKAIAGGGGGILGAFASLLGSDGNVYAWGYNGDGELGDGTTTGPETCGTQSYPCSMNPTKVSLPVGVTATAIDGNAVGGTAIGSDGNIYAWGAGALGNGSSGGSDVPVAVSFPSGSVPLDLGAGPSATTSYAIVGAPDVAPSVTTQPSSRSVVEGTGVTFTAAASGFPIPTIQWQVSTDGGSTWTDVSGATTNPLSETATLSENGDQYRAVFTNSLGSATSDPATLTVPPPPVTSVLLPSNGATIISGTWLDAAASSPAGLGIASVVFEVSGIGVNDLVISGSAPTPYGYIGAWNSSDVANGTYSVQSVATDTLGQSTTSAPVSVTVDNPPLHTEILVPSSGATLSGTNAVLDATAAGTSPITSVRFEITRGSLSDFVVGTGVLTPYGYIAEWDTTKVTNGTYSLQSVATETGGTTATSPGITVRVQNERQAHPVASP